MTSSPNGRDDAARVADSDTHAAAVLALSYARSHLERGQPARGLEALRGLDGMGLAPRAAAEVAAVRGDLLAATGAMREARSAWAEAFGGLAGARRLEVAAADLRAAVLLGETGGLWEGLEVGSGSGAAGVVLQVTAAWAGSDAVSLMRLLSEAEARGRPGLACLAGVLHAEVMDRAGEPGAARASLRRAKAMSAEADARTRRLARRLDALLALRHDDDPEEALRTLRGLVQEAIASEDHCAEAATRVVLALGLMRANPTAAGVEADLAHHLARGHGYRSLGLRAAALARLFGAGDPVVAVEDPAEAEDRLLLCAARVPDGPVPERVAAMEEALAAIPAANQPLFGAVVDRALSLVGIRRVASGLSPSLLLQPREGRAWYGGECAADLGRSLTLYRLLEVVASRGAALTRETLFETVWEETYRPPSSDAKVYMGVKRLRERLAPDTIAIASYGEGSYVLEGNPAVLEWTPEGSGPVAPVRVERVEVETNLQSRANAFVGRTAEISAIHEALQRARVVTLYGATGVGTSRLALEYGLRHAASHAPGGVWWIDLEETGSVVLAVAIALGLPLRGAIRAQDAVGCAVAARGRILLVLDGASDAPVSVAEVVERWTHLAPEARFLVTSRTPIGVGGERPVALAPLQRRDAAALFAARAQEKQGSFALSRSDLEVVDRIADCVEGLPLAVELAAGRADAVSPGGLLKDLEKRLRKMGVDDALAASIGSAWDQLEPPLREVLAQCTVFRGGFTAEAADVVVVSEDDRTWVADAVDRLSRATLLRIEHPRGERAPVRFRMHEAVRAFAAHHLDDAALGAAGDRHARHFAALGEQLREAAAGPEAAQAQRHFAAERDNLLAAVDRGLSLEEGALGVRLALAVDVLLSGMAAVRSRREVLERAAPFARGDLRVALLAALATVTARCGGAASEVEAMAKRALDAVGPDTPPTLLSELHSCLGTALRTADRERRRDHHRNAVAWAEKARDARRLGLALGAWGRFEWQVGHARNADYLLRRAVSQLGASGDVLHAAWFQMWHALVLWDRGQREQAERRCEEAVELLQSSGDRGLLREAAENHGHLLLQLGRPEEARARFECALAIHLSMGDLARAALARTSLGRLHFREGNPERGLTLAEEALDEARLLGDTGVVEGVVRTVLAAMYLERGEHDLARGHLREVRDGVGPLPLEEEVLEGAHRCLEGAVALLDRAGTGSGGEEVAHAARLLREALERAGGPD